MARSQLVDFIDVADGDILKSRQKLKLEDFVPFHFFARNPFDGRVQVDNPKSEFILITVTRDFAIKNSWKIVPKHPLAEDDLELFNYEQGMTAINWDKMDARDYSDNESKSVCMAECLSSKTIEANNFFSIYVKSEESKRIVKESMKEFKLPVRINVNNKMFIGN